jgi:hypothetical protein
MERYRKSQQVPGGSKEDPGCKHFYVILRGRHTTAHDHDPWLHFRICVRICTGCCNDTWMTELESRARCHLVAQETRITICLYRSLANKIRDFVNERTCDDEDPTDSSNTRLVRPNTKNYQPLKSRIRSLASQHHTYHHGKFR